MQPGSATRLGLRTATLAGVVAGLAGAVVMNQLQRTWRSVSQTHAASKRDGTSAHKQPTDIETSGMIVSRLACRLRLDISPRSLRIMTLAMHYGVGASTGVLYGICRAFTSTAFQPRRHPALDGAILGGTIFIAADQLAAPALGFRKRELMGTPAFGILSHLVFGGVAVVTFDGMYSVLTRSGRPQSASEIREIL